ncbi:MAG TPA: hypothetical protein VMM12_12380 [Longimicrobiales bacterium]|nr:hypothetical protein [Longimicrobiales bacterium]
MTRRLLPVLCLAALAACSGGQPDEAAVRRDSMTQRQRDSIIGESGLPGARGVRGALDASDAAAARAAAHDTLSGGR